MLDAAAQNVDDAPFGDLALKAMKELNAPRSVFAGAERLDDVRLCRPQEVEQLRQVYSVIAIEVR